MIINNKPLVSILMNSYNSESHIEHAINSVLSQTYKNWELIIWDNCSIDSSISIIDKFRKKDQRIKLYTAKKHTDLGNARSLAWKYLRGKYLAILDTDDYFEDKKIEIQVHCLEKNLDYGICFSNTIYFNEKKNYPLYKKNPPVSEGISRLIEKYYISLGSVLINLDKAKKNNLSFDGYFSHIADFDLIIKLASKEKIIYVDSILSGWRLRSTSLTWTNQDQFYKELIKWTNENLKNNDLNIYSSSLIKLKKRSIQRFLGENIINGDLENARKTISNKKYKKYLNNYSFFNIFVYLVRRYVQILLFKLNNI